VVCEGVNARKDKVFTCNRKGLLVNNFIYIIENEIPIADNEVPITDDKI
jgi:hypothetical protein